MSTVYIVILLYCMCVVSMVVCTCKFNFCGQLSPPTPCYSLTLLKLRTTRSRIPRGTEPEGSNLEDISSNKDGKHLVSYMKVDLKTSQECVNSMAYLIVRPLDPRPHIHCSSSLVCSL